MACWTCQYRFVRISEDRSSPVAVDVTADTCVTAHSLSVLAPKTISGLRIEEAIRIDDGRDVEVELIDERFDGRI
jgi:hypothetical protein